MGDTERPIPERDGGQEEQAAHLTRTGNGPTVDNEVELLAAEYGPADMSGYHSLPAPAEDVVDDAPADQDDAAPAADGTAEGSEQA